MAEKKRQKDAVELRLAEEAERYEKVKETIKVSFEKLSQENERKTKEETQKLKDITEKYNSEVQRVKTWLGTRSAEGLAKGKQSSSAAGSGEVALKPSAVKRDEMIAFFLWKYPQSTKIQAEAFADTSASYMNAATDRQKRQEEAEAAATAAAKEKNEKAAADEKSGSEEDTCGIAPMDTSASTDGKRKADGPAEGEQEPKSLIV